MVAAVLFTWPDRHFGPTATNLFRVKGMTEVLVTVDGMEWRYRGPVSPVTLRQKPGNKDGVVLFLYDEDVLIDLTAVPGAIAVAVDDGRDSRILWINEGQGVRAENGWMMTSARALVEARCCPSDGYEL
jgi:hypothetical protein